MSGPKGIDFYYGDGTPSIAGQTFDVIKASEGAGFPPDGPIPDWYASEQAKIRAGGALFGAYHFWHPSVDNAAQVANFKKRANFRPGDIGQLDCEVTDGLDWATVNARKNDMLAKLKAEFPQNRWLLYTYLDFFSHLDGNVGDGLWIADPDAPAGSPRVPHWVIHQYGSGNVDYDIANFPDAQALRAWATSPGADMDATQANQLQQLYNATFLGGDSMGEPAPGAATNSLAESVGYLVKTVGALAAPVDAKALAAAVVTGLTPVVNAALAAGTPIDYDHLAIVAEQHLAATLAQAK